MNRDNYNEIINGQGTYETIARWLCDENFGRVLIGWTDEIGTHYDVLFVLAAPSFGSNIQGGINSDKDLFVSIMRKGCFSFNCEHEDTHYSYYAEKLNLDGDDTNKKLSELINGVKIEINKKK